MPNIDTNYEVVYGLNKNKLNKKADVINEYATLKNLDENKKYFYKIQSIKKLKGYNKESEIFYFITGKNPFNIPNKYTKSKKYKNLAKEILKNSNFKKGYCLIENGGDGALAYELAKQSDLYIISFDKNKKLIDNGRTILNDMGLLGSRISLTHGKMSKADIQHNIANLVISLNELNSDNIKKLYKLVRPINGQLILISLKDIDKEKYKFDSAKTSEKQLNEFNSLIFEKTALQGAGEWVTLYGDFAGTACSKDEIITPKKKYEIQWYGEPGPTRMNDRHHRQMAPIYKNGTLYILGTEYLYGVDAYNGTIYWERPFFESTRLGIMGDCSSMSANNNNLFIASGSDCFGIDAISGKIKYKYQLSNKYHWGYVAVKNNMLWGTKIKKDSSLKRLERVSYGMYKTFHKMITSSSIFAYNNKFKKKIWEYEKGIIINPSIVHGDNKIFFVECRNNKLQKEPTGRYDLNKMLDGKNAYIVALNEKTGKVEWEKKFNNKFQYILYLQYIKGSVIASGSFKNKKKIYYHIN